MIEMNRELAYGGYRFFQSSYRETPGRDQTILSVSRDPGEAVVFLGYYGLVIGMIVVLATRIAERRRASRPAATAGLAALALLAAAPGHGQTMPPMPPAADVEALRRLPVQHDGRVMPFDTLAREAVWNVTGRRSVWGVDPVAMTLGWALDPRAWVVQPIVPVKDARLAAEIGLPAGARWSSFEALAGNQRLLQLFNAARAAEQQERSPLEKAAQKVEGRLLWMQQVLDHSALRFSPSAKPGDAWTVPEHLHSAAEFRALADSGDAAAGRISRDAVERELLYNRARPTRLAWWILTLSLLLSMAAWPRTAAPSTSPRAPSSSPGSRS